MLSDTAEITTVSAIDAEDARRLTDQIKVGTEAIWQLVEEAYRSRAWAALGYPSWNDYCTREFGAGRIRIPREDREEIVGSMHDLGMSVRAIAAATGESGRTVHRAIGVANATPEPAPAPFDDEPIDAELVELVARMDGLVARMDEQLDAADELEPEPAPPAPTTTTGLDGKTYRRPTTPAPRRSSLPDAARRRGRELRRSIDSMERIVADNRFAANRELADRVAADLRYTVEKGRELLDAIDRTGS